MKSFGDGRLSEALSVFLDILRKGQESPLLRFMLGQTYQRLQQFDHALRHVDEGLNLRTTPGSDRLKLLTLKAQILSSQQQWAPAAAVYEIIVREEPRPPALRYARLQLSAMYERLGELDRAKHLITLILNRDPEDEIARRKQAILEQGATPPINEPADDEGLGELALVLPDEPAGRLSSLLLRDFDTTSFRDERILANGGQATAADAERLLTFALEAKNADFPERYPLFLEAAKAYSQLPQGSYDLGRYLHALARYSLAKGGALASELRRRTRSPETRLEDLRRIRDSAMSYYLEALGFQAAMNPKFMVVPLTNYLRVQVVCAIKEAGGRVTEDLFQKPFGDLFAFCLRGARDDRGPTDPEHLADRLATIAYETVVSCGSAGGRIWRAVNALRGSFSGSLSDPIQRQRVYLILGDISGQRFPSEVRPRDVLQQAFAERTRRSLEINSLIAKVNSIAPTSHNFRELHSLWRTFPAHPGTLLDTDLEFLRRIEALLAALAPYSARSQEERTGILFTARTMIEHLLRELDDYPTRWGREAFQPLLQRWGRGIREIERRRLKDIQPDLRSRLEPNVFVLDHESVNGGVMLENVGLGTADAVVLRSTLRDYLGSEVLWTTETKTNDEVKPRDPRSTAPGTYYHPLTIPRRAFRSGLDAVYRLHLQLRPIYRQAELDPVETEFTVEIGSDSGPDPLPPIPWNEVEIPSQHMFKGREALITTLQDHLQSSERTKTYILYGLTRTGKTSILRHLQRRLDLRPFPTGGKPMRFVCFEWNFAEASSQSSDSDFWNYLVEANILAKLRHLAATNAISVDPGWAERNEAVRFSDWADALRTMSDHSIYPVFLIDEFSYYGEMVRRQRIDASFLAMLREFAISGLASFVCAGTYDLRQLMKDPAYGITGQLVNSIELQVSRINREAAIELMSVMEPSLRFTSDAMEHVLHLSDGLPYFIQLICRRAAEAAHKTGRRVIGFSDVELVTQVLTGELDDYGLALPPIAASVFDDNMYMKRDPRTFGAVFSTICELVRGSRRPRSVTYREIQDTWTSNGVVALDAQLSRTLEELRIREVLIREDDEGAPAYRLGADLFRRWWAAQHPHLGPELDALKEST